MNKIINKTAVGIICSTIIFPLIFPLGQRLPQVVEETKPVIDLTGLYSSNEAWEQSYKEVTKQINALTEYEGQLGDENKLSEYLKLNEEINKEIEKLHVYTILTTSIDQSNQESIAQKGKIQQLQTDYLQKEELLMQGLEDEEMEGEGDSFYMRIAAMLDQIDTVYEQILYADNDGMNEEDYSQKLQNRQYSLAALYNMEVSKEVIFGQTLGYDNIIAYLTDKQGVDEEVYEVAKKEVKKMKPLLERYIELSSNMNIHISPEEYTYAHVPQLVQEAYQIFGPTYTDIAKRAFEENWIDPFRAPHKSEGAFAIGTYTTHPYIVLNYEETPDGLATVAHELGHGIHYELSRNNQPYETWEADILAAEIASIAAEQSVYETIYQNAKTNEEKQTALVLKAESLFNTLFYQMTIAEFEEKAYKLVESGETLTAETLNRIWEEANKEYYEVNYSQDGDWAGISHIFENFYTFQYATDFVAAEAVVSELMNGNEEMQKKWIKFLQSGGEKAGYELTKEVLGIDLKKPQYYENVAAQFEACLDELEMIS
ncbi:M3 family metallopeptidase [Niameybacter massiliensis]|uniref:M3 family metallopeptidase n=1 Tax=Holtiella tumoricola TaxID=3018743 RepID=A0AA42DQY5_9FIRM|nr:M3 family metallopeptidase [Holtiella tumoricola]MDA3733481.1 M3 family metallopeptidase [Holtiella tumoricola]